MNELVVSEIQIIPVRPKNGLVAFASCLYSGRLSLSDNYHKGNRVEREFKERTYEISEEELKRLDDICEENITRGKSQEEIEEERKEERKKEKEKDKMLWGKYAPKGIKYPK